MLLDFNIYAWFDYQRVIVNARQELILICAHTDRDYYMGVLDSEFEITKLQWQIPHIIVNDRQAFTFR